MYVTLKFTHSQTCTELCQISVPGCCTVIFLSRLCRFFGCGLPFPAKLEGCRVLDLGSGSGRDCYVFSKLVGENGHVTGIDMTEELVIIRAVTQPLVTPFQCSRLSYPAYLQIAASRQYIEYHQKTFGYQESNVSFVLGYMEDLSAAGIQKDSVDVVL